MRLLQIACHSVTRRLLALIPACRSCPPGYSPLTGIAQPGCYKTCPASTDSYDKPNPVRPRRILLWHDAVRLAPHPELLPARMCWPRHHTLHLLCCAALPPDCWALHLPFPPAQLCCVKCPKGYAPGVNVRTCVRNFLSAAQPFTSQRRCALRPYAPRTLQLAPQPRPQASASCPTSSILVTGSGAATCKTCASGSAYWAQRGRRGPVVRAMCWEALRQELLLGGRKEQ